MNDIVKVSSLAKKTRDREPRVCGTRIRSERQPENPSARTAMAFVVLRSAKSRGHLSRITTPGLTARRVSPRVMHSPPPALAAEREDEEEDSDGRTDGRAD